MAKVLTIPRDQDNAVLTVDGKDVRVTNLRKIFWPEIGLTKGDLLQYYADVADVLLPHIRDRAMVMKRYPDGPKGKFFFMKQVPEYRPEWLEICSIDHPSAKMVDFAMIEDLPSLLWVVNLGCIDLNPWYATCDDISKPDAMHFDLDPVEGTGFDRVIDTALAVREALMQLGIESYAKTSGASGIHVSAPIVRGPSQKEITAFAREIARVLESVHPKLITGEFRIAKRPAKHVLVDYNQNAWGKTLASVYSVRPAPRATVSTPVRWEELEHGVRTEDFRIDNVPARLHEVGDLWAPFLARRGRFDLARLAKEVPGPKC